LLQATGTPVTSRSSEVLGEEDMLSNSVKHLKRILIVAEVFELVVRDFAVIMIIA